MTVWPLRLTRDRIAIYGLLLIALCLVQVRFVVAQGYGDWSAFFAAGATAGTRDLLDPQRHNQWQTAHHLLTTIFPYLPAAAWLFTPFKNLSLAAGYAGNFAIMAVFAALAAVVASQTYRISKPFAVIATFAFAPVIAALATGQNSPLGLLLSMCAVWALVTEQELILGLACGALLYKFPYAVPFICVCAVRKQFRALAITAACAALWYAASAIATGGDWQWPVHYVAALSGYFTADARQNAVKAVSVPGLLLRTGAAPAAAIAVGAGLFLIALPLLARRSSLEAASLAPLVALSANSHTQPYDTVLALPALLFFMTRAAEPWRTRVTGAVYVLAPLWLFSGIVRFDILAVLCDIPVLIWLVKGYDESTSGPYFRFAHSGDRR